MCKERKTVKRRINEIISCLITVFRQTMEYRKEGENTVKIGNKV